MAVRDGAIASFMPGGAQQRSGQIAGDLKQIGALWARHVARERHMHVRNSTVPRRSIATSTLLATRSAIPRITTAQEATCGLGCEHRVIRRRRDGGRREGREVSSAGFGRRTKRMATRASMLLASTK